VKETGITFTGESVRAIYAGRKTMTRRPIIHQKRPLADFAFYEVDGNEVRDEDGNAIRCYHGGVGDRLWVKERWYPAYARTEKMSGCVFPSLSTGLIGNGDPQEANASWRPHEGWKSPRFMPKWAARLWLEITELRVERLQDISTEDVIAEGLSTTLREHDAVCDLNDQYHQLWDKINGKKSWDENPWVWVIGFKRLEVSRG
jgi:hypothetical protein